MNQADLIAHVANATGMSKADAGRAVEAVFNGIADELAAARSWSVEVIDLRCLVPLDIDTVLASVRRTGRLVVVHEAPFSGGFGAELVALVHSRAFEYLCAPAERVAGHDLPYSFSTGDEYFRPDEARIRAAIRRVMEYEF